MRAPATRETKTRAWRSKRSTTPEESTVKINLLQGQKTTTIPTREHPPEGKERDTKDRKESSDTEGQKAQFTQNPQTKPHTVNKVIKKKKFKTQKTKKSQKPQKLSTLIHRYHKTRLRGRPRKQGPAFIQNEFQQPNDSRSAPHPEEP